MLQSTVNGLTSDVKDLAGSVAHDRAHMQQFWQFMVGQVPNGHVREIKPSPTSYCGMTTIGIANLRKLVLFSLGVVVFMNGVEHSDNVSKLVGEVLKWVAR